MRDDSAMDYRQKLFKEIFFLIVLVVLEIVLMWLGWRRQVLSGWIIAIFVVGFALFSGAIFQRLVLLQIGKNPETYRQYMGLPIARFVDKKGKADSGYYAYPPEKRQEIVNDYRRARACGEVMNKDKWAQSKYNISGKTLLEYEREFSEITEVKGDKQGV
jgi:hypothetical protein